MKKEQLDYQNEKTGFFTGANKAVIAFVCAFLVTVSIGGVALLSMKAGKTTKIVEADVFEEETVAARLPFSEKRSDDIGGTADVSLQGEATAADNALADGENDTEIVAGEETAEGSGESGDESQNDESSEGTDDAGEAVESTGETYISGANWEYNITPANSDYVSLAFAGDILFDSGYAIMNKIRQNGGGIEGVIGGSLLSYMRGADIMVVNNEFPYSNRGTPIEGKTFTFRADPSSAALLNQMGVDVATLANNHAYDHGEQALLDTLSTLDSVGVARIGAGANLEEASHPVYYTSSNGIKIAIISATEIERIDNPDTRGATDTSPGVFRCLDITKLLSRIKEAKAAGAYTIVCIHWGTENDETIDWWQQKQGPEIVAAGADLIVGAHPHILQKIGYIDGVPVIYSLGNFLFNSKDLNTGLLRVNIYTDGHTGLQFVPCVQSGCTVNEATGERKTAILNHMREMSVGVSINDEGYVQ
ncbi:CapA family protein [Butyrivibrio sp. INlla16]|uniref:CapA family protein n=1 Tax=Butyrivibrio sp. INlla16 TaxID=1520807 RepID=UPI00087FD493|nr:CapA family protein [Butyrivibrio sp. INlla16]SDB10503.1 poly-gamma-glutamate synthesis protein (capsule biosynthesis protein) [Butyrivibrio sp. INlla16]